MALLEQTFGMYQGEGQMARVGQARHDQAMHTNSDDRRREGEVLRRDQFDLGGMRCRGGHLSDQAASVHDWITLLDSVPATDIYGYGHIRVGQGADDHFAGHWPGFVGNGSAPVQRAQRPQFAVFGFGRLSRDSLPSQRPHLLFQGLIRGAVVQGFGNPITKIARRLKCPASDRVEVKYARRSSKTDQYEDYERASNPLTPSELLLTNWRSR